MDNSNSIDLVDYSRQEAMNFRTHLDAYAIIGCGGIGFWAGIMLAMLGNDKFILIDGDKIEPSNLNRLPVPQTWIGINKAIALRRLMRTMRPASIITCITKNVCEENVEILETMMGSSTQSFGIIDATDDARIQRKIYSVFKLKYPYIKIGYEGFNVGAYKNMDVWIPEDYRPGYRTAQSNVLSSAMGAGLGILAFSLANKDVQFDLSKLVRGEYGPKET